LCWYNGSAWQSIGDGGAGGGLVAGDIDTIAELFAIITDEGTGLAALMDNAVDAAGGLVSFDYIDTNIPAISGTPAQGDILYFNGTDWVLLVKSSTTGHALRNTGTSNNPAWGLVDVSAVTGDLAYANLTQASATSRFLCRVTAAAGDWEECTAANAWTVLSIVPDANMPNLTGDVTTTEGAVATTIANDAVTYAKLQNVSATSRILGRITSGAGDAEELTAANVKTILSTMALRPVYLFNAAGCDNTTAGTGLNLFTSNRPTAACTTGTNTTFGRLQFTATGQQAQGHIAIPSDISGTTMTVSGHYFGETTSAGNTTWRFSWSRVAAGGTLDPAWTDCDISDAAGTANQLNLFTSTSCTITGLAAGDLFFWKITYQTAPTTPGNHNLINLFLQPLRDMVIGG